jgi:hypothetical protein
LENVKVRGQPAYVGDVSIKMCREEKGYEDMDWIYLDQALLNTLMNLGVP